MMLWTAAEPAPNPRRVNIFLRTKGIDLPKTEFDLFKGEHKNAACLAKNPRGQVPFLELDDGRVIAETIAICRYLDELYPEPPLFGSTAFERAETDMWTRRVETQLGTAVGQAWVHGHPFTAKMFTQVPAIAEAARGTATAAYRWFDKQLAGRTWLAGDRATMADIALLTIVDFADWIEVRAPAECADFAAWHGRAKARFV